MHKHTTLTRMPLYTSHTHTHAQRVKVWNYIHICIHTVQYVKHGMAHVLWTGTQPINVFWRHNNMEITADTPGITLHSADGIHSLFISSAYTINAGEYMCEAFNDYGNTNTVCRLTVKGIHL